MQLYLGSNIPQYMEEFIDFAVGYLGIDRLRGEISITYKTRLEEEAFGVCWGDRSECEIQIGSTTFGEKISREDKLKTIAHELTHARQYLTGQLKCDTSCTTENKMWKSIWEGKVYRYRPQNEVNKPWETEAVELESEIYEEWLERQ